MRDDNNTETAINAWYNLIAFDRKNYIIKYNKLLSQKSEDNRVILKRRGSNKFRCGKNTINWLD